MFLHVWLLSNFMYIIGKPIVRCTSAYCSEHEIDFDFIVLVICTEAMEMSSLHRVAMQIHTYIKITSHRKQ